MIIRKITAGPSAVKDSMAFEVGQIVYAHNKVHHIEECEDRSYIIYIKKDGEIKAWKKYSPTVPVHLEYDLEYSENR